jgi:hypothetical protein
MRPPDRKARAVSDDPINVKDLEPIPLHGHNGPEPVAFLCGRCKTTAGVFSAHALGVDGARKAADGHCYRECDICKSPLKLGQSCDTCADARRERWLAEAWEKAKKISYREYEHGYLSAPDARDELFVCLNDLLEYCHDEDIDVPERIFGCERIVLRLDAQIILENALEEHHEDAMDDISPSMESDLQAFLDDWSKKANVVTFVEDRSLGIIIPR